jgi:hypothetical protein
MVFRRVFPGGHYSRNPFTKKTVESTPNLNLRYTMELKLSFAIMGENQICKLDSLFCILFHQESYPGDVYQICIIYYPFLIESTDRITCYVLNEPSII